jgi:AcrR family transcriptional regulator
VPERASRADRKAATRAALIDAGERLVLKKGFGVSVEDIAAEAGFTKGAIYSNFSGRTELIIEICRRVAPGLLVDFDTTIPSLGDALEDTGWQLLAAADADREQIVLQLDALVQMLRDPELHRAMLAYAAEVNAAAKPDDPLPWPLPLPEEQWLVACNAVAIGLVVQRVIYGKERVPDELFGWLNRRLAGD